MVTTAGTVVSQLLDDGHDLNDALMASILRRVDAALREAYERGRQSAKPKS